MHYYYWEGEGETWRAEQQTLVTINHHRGD